jgi:hypothetical protein
MEAIAAPIPAEVNHSKRIESEMVTLCENAQSVKIEKALLKISVPGLIPHGLSLQRTDEAGCLLKLARPLRPSPTAYESTRTSKPRLSSPSWFKGEEW